MLNLKANSCNEDGYPIIPSNWTRTCDTCQAAACTLYCHTESAYLCRDCDGRIHSANSLALSHDRVWLCTVCENAPAAVTCKADAASLCSNCDVEIHSVNALARRHSRLPIPPLSGIAYLSSSSTSSTAFRDEPPGPMLVPENEIMANESNEEIDEDEAYSWLLLEPDQDDNQTNSATFTYSYSEPVDDDEYVDLMDSCAEKQPCCVIQEDNASDSAVSVQSCKVKTKRQKQEDKVRQKQQQQTRNQQPQRNLDFSREHEASKSAFFSTPSSSQNGSSAALSPVLKGFPYGSFSGATNQWPILVPTSFITAGILPNARSSNVPSPFSTFPNGPAMDIFPNASLLVPLQFSPMNREAKVRRYREKRKARKFEKKIRYASRKAYAETRPRVKGRFARKTEMEIIDEDQLFAKEDYGYGIVPSL